MGIPSILSTGYSGLMAAKSGIATTGHNIANANTEGYSRQRVITEAADPHSGGTKVSSAIFGTGTRVARVERVNDQYVEKQIRLAAKEQEFFEEKDLALKQIEDIFNEMNGDGLNRLISRFFNEFRKLANEPENIAVRQSVRESSQALVNDFHRIRHEVREVVEHLDARIEGYSGEVNTLAKSLKELNDEIRTLDTQSTAPNDLMDKRDMVLKKLNTLLDVTMYKDKVGNFIVDMRGIGPLVTGGDAETLSVERSGADDRGKAEGALDIRSTSVVGGAITHSIKGGRLGALLEVRDKTLSTIVERLDELAYTLSNAVNEVHTQGYTISGQTGVDFFNRLESKDRAAEFITLSDEVLSNVNHIATAMDPDSPGDNRIALAIAGLQGIRLANQGAATLDDYYDSIVSDVGVVSARTRFSLNQHKDIMSQLQKVREQISGVSIDEETANLLQYQHVFDASAKMIQVADELLKTILAIKT